jgi:CDP-glycerol glycerophosphotransferase (TagB/SpsB family)
MRVSKHELTAAGSALLRPVQFLLYLASGLVPRRRGLWVFGSWGGYRFADNAAAFFRHCLAHPEPGRQVVWISRDRSIVRRLRADGMEAHWVWSPRGIARSVRAELYVFDCFSKDINFWLSNGATKVNLWSGVPLKVFERDIDTPGNRYHRLFHGRRWERLVLGAMMPWHVVRPDLLIATSETTADITRRAFDVDDEAVVVTGFPRNDLLVDIELAAAHGDRPGVDEIRRAYEADRRIFIYLPTFRDSAKPFLTIDWKKLETVLDELDAMFFIKFHPVDATAFDHASERIVQLYQDTDVYDVLPYATALISDYSSVIFDFMLLDRPIIYFVPDLEEFVSSSRSLLFDPRKIAVGPLCTNSGDLLAALADVAAANRLTEAEEAHRVSVLTLLHTHLDGNAAQRVRAAIEEIR